MKSYFRLNCVAGLLLASLACYGTPLVYDSAVPQSAWSGASATRSAPSNGVVGNGSWNNFSISWNISLTGSTYHYAYNLGGLNGKDISHFILDLSDNCTDCRPCLSDIDPNVSVDYGTFGPGPSNPGFPSGKSITGVKFDGLPQHMTTISFDTLRSPVWGDFYAKDGVSHASDGGSGGQVWNYAYNTGLANHNSSSVTDFIARPDTTGAPVPEPGSWAMMLSGGLLVALSVWLRKHHR